MSRGLENKNRRAGITQRSGVARSCHHCWRPQPKGRLLSFHLPVSCKCLSLAKPKLETHRKGVWAMFKAFQPLWYRKVWISKGGGYFSKWCGEVSYASGRKKPQKTKTKQKNKTQSLIHTLYKYKFQKKRKFKRNNESIWIR